MTVVEISTFFLTLKGFRFKRMKKRLTAMTHEEVEWSEERETLSWETKQKERERRERKETIERERKSRERERRRLRETERREEERKRREREREACFL